MARRNLKDARIIVTGASSGIGRSLAIQLCQRGAHVLATARRAAIAPAPFLFHQIFITSFIAIKLPAELDGIYPFKHS